MRLTIKKIALFLALASCVIHYAQAEENGADWWNESAWNAMSDAFFYYGDPVEQHDLKAMPEQTRPLSSLNSIADIREERKKRLEKAILSPTPENLLLVREIDAHIMKLSARYAELWNNNRIENPEHDWTASNPTAAFALLERKRLEEETNVNVLKQIGGAAGLLVLGNLEDYKTNQLLRSVHLVCKAHSMDCLAVLHSRFITQERRVNTSSFKGLEDVAMNAIVEPGGFSKSMKIRVLPAVVLIPKPGMRNSRIFNEIQKQLSKGFVLIASGVVSSYELENRILSVVFPPKPGVDSRRFERITQVQSQIYEQNTNTNEVYKRSYSDSEILKLPNGASLTRPSLAPDSTCPSGACALPYEMKRKIK